MLGTPVVTMRDTTKWVETVQCGWNILTNVDQNKINDAISAFQNAKPRPLDPMKFYGEGKASERIAKIVANYLENIG